MKTLFVTDLDGTLLGADSRVSERSARILTDLSRRGALITAATARTPATVQPLLSAIESTVPTIVMTGAALWDRANSRFLSTSTIPRDVAAQIIRICHDRGINPFVYCLVEGEPSGCVLRVYHGGSCTRAEQRFIDERRHLQLKRFALLPQPISQLSQLGTDHAERIVLMFAIGPVYSIFAAANALRGLGNCAISAYIDIFGASTGILEVYHQGVSKAAAIQSLAKRLGAERIVAFGDNLNDLPMLRLADEAYAVANALPEVKAEATGIIGPNTDDSVALKIKEIFERIWD